MLNRATYQRNVDGKWEVIVGIEMHYGSARRGPMITWRLRARAPPIAR